MTTQLLLGGHIYSAFAPDATAMAVTDGTVVWLGEDATARTLHPDAEVIDLAGAFVAPAFVDAHAHVTATGLALTGLDLSTARNKAEALAALRAFAASRPDAVLLAQGWDASVWPDAEPTTAEIDEAVGNRPAYVVRIDVHSAAASSALRAQVDALAGLPGYDAEQPLTADAHHAVRAAAHAGVDADARRAARRAALDAFAAAGVVAVHECAGPDISSATDLRELLGTPHPVQVRGYWGEAVDSAEQAKALLEQTGADALGGDLFIDGALGSHTAWLTEPYADQPQSTGVAYLSTEQVAAHLRACTEAGIQAGFHVIGDAAMAAFTAAVEQVVAEFGGPRVALLGHRVEHAELMSLAQAETLGRYGILAAVQPMFDALWGGPDGLYAQRLGAERATTMNRCTMMASNGIGLAIGSDAPVTTINPWEQIRAAAAPHTEGNAISPRAAFAAATRGAWRAGGVRDGLAGTLEPGAPASYAIWDDVELVRAVPSDRVQRWSMDPRSRVPALPKLGADVPLPVLRSSVHRGVQVFAR